ncbi:hypothetical protein [Butyrivibrio sp. WCE2006]|uniref:hypothetical protein n=1 Tax=Butyrivibrio sp. WCE2006 TaxID=1410611 RepID=UPI0005D15E2A
MSYDIYLKEKATGQTIGLPINHVMVGGTCYSVYDEKTCRFSMGATAEAQLNIPVKDLREFKSPP